jgi:hypothetical protein
MAPLFSKTLFRTLLVLAASLLALQAFRTDVFKTFSLSDFGEYWAAGRLLLAHSNPYSPPALLALQSSVGFTRHDAIMMWNPPWALSIVLPFASLPYGMASFLWLIVKYSGYPFRRQLLVASFLRFQRWLRSLDPGGHIRSRAHQFAGRPSHPFYSAGNWRFHLLLAPSTPFSCRRFGCIIQE